MKPALNEIAQMLGTRGWVAVVNAPGNPKADITFQIYKDAMVAIAGTGRPHISFTFEKYSRKLTTHFTTTSQSSSGLPLI